MIPGVVWSVLLASESRASRSRWSWDKSSSPRWRSASICCLSSWWLISRAALCDSVCSIRLLSLSVSATRNAPPSNTSKAAVMRTATGQRSKRRKLKEGLLFEPMCSDRATFRLARDIRRSTLWRTRLSPGVPASAENDPRNAPVETVKARPRHRCRSNHLRRSKAVRKTPGRLCTVARFAPAPLRSIHQAGIGLTIHRFQQTVSIRLYS